MTTGQSIGWVGLGKLGLPMAARLAGAGYAIDGYDRDQERIALAGQQGIAPAATPETAARDKDVVFASLPDDKVLRAAALGDDGLLARMRAGAIFAETSTVSAGASADVAREAETRGIAYLRLPISGNASIAHTGNLSCFASGPRAPSRSCSPLWRPSPRPRPIWARARRRATPSSPST
jgi:3-hydroxyisobutyrate dehydrogenase-like beta-hydroxyacid dehydrogenase